MVPGKLIAPCVIALAACVGATPSRAAAPDPEAPAEAATDGPVVGLAPRVGLDIPTSKLGVFVVGGLEIDVFLPVLERQLVLALDLTYTAPSHDGAGSDPRVGGAYAYTIAERELKIGLDLAYRFASHEASIVPFVGVGFVLQLLQSRETTSFGPNADHLEQSTEPGVEVFGGADFKLGPGYLLGELRFVHTGLDHRLTGNSNAGNVTLSVGYRFVF